nr:hypothetical protein [Streptococcus mitis]
MPEFPSKDGEKPKKDIPGYRFVETKPLPNGDVEHIYNKSNATSSNTFTCSSTKSR